MASKKKADGSPPPSGAAPSAAPAVTQRVSPPTVRVPSAEDLDLARNDALLQLRIGQSAHYYTILVAMALLFDILLVLYFPPNPGRNAPDTLRNLYFLAFPLIGAVFLALVGLRVKWETYQLWPWEGHFWVSLAAVAYNAALTYLFLASAFKFGPTQAWPLLPWLFPAVMGGLTICLVGLALTWSEWSRRKTVSVAAAVLPIPIAFVLFLSPSSPQVAVNALALCLSASAVLYLISGGFLHIISSGTRTHEREVITSGQSRLFQVAEEVRRREEAHRFREATLLKREADAEDAEDGIRRQRESVETARRQIDEMEADLRQRSEALREAEGSYVGRSAEVTTLAQTLQDKQADLELREKDVRARMPKLAEREQMILQREAEHRQREVELGRREQELARREQSVPEGEADLERRRQEIERRTADLLRRESDLKTREAGGEVRPAVPGSASLEEREARLAQLKITLDEQNLVLGRKARQLDDSLREILRREQEISHREEGVTGREASLTQRETDAKEQYELSDARRTQYEDALHQYEERIREADRRDAELGSRKGELERTGLTLTQREAQLREREQQLSVQRTSLDRLQRVLAERQKGLDAREDEVSLRAQAIGRGSTSSTATPEGATPPLAGAPTHDLLAPPVARRIADRQPTGTPRLDDLLQGGIPPRGQALVVGDAFVGKEIVLYAFLAEGLKRGEPVIIVTTSRSPDEVGQQIGLVAPQFQEYEQMGRVAWVDASRPQSGPGAPASNPSHPHTAAVAGPDDHAGILRSLVTAARQAEGAGPGFRVAYFGLAASLAHADERAGMIFLQNLVGILRPRPALAMYSLEAGALTDAQSEQILARMDGAIRFKQERDKTFLAVAGFGEVATREWIEVRATNRALVVGSFSLERIR